MKRKASFSILGTILVFSLLAGFTTSTAHPASAESSPWILANPSAHWVHGLEWPLGVELTLTIGDYSAKSTTVVAQWDPTITSAYFDLTGKIDLVPGDIVVVSGDNVTKELTITNLTVTSVDVATNTLSGTASPGVSVSAGADNNTGDARSAVAGEDGIWSMAPVPGGFVLGRGVSGWAVEIDSDWDQTRMDWHVPNPRFDVRANVDEVGASEWTMGETLTLTIGEHEFNETVRPRDGNPEDPYASFNLAGIYDIQPGALVSLTNGTITKTTIVTGLEITEIDVDQNMVKGKAAAGSKVDLWACVSNGCFNRHVTADGEGNWLADFAHSGAEGDEKDIVDLLPGTWVDSRQADDDGDATMYGQSVPNPRFDVRANDDVVEGYEWKIGETVTLQIGDQKFSRIVRPADWNPEDSYVLFDLSGLYDIQPGDLVSLTNGTTPKTTVVTVLEITEINVDQDTVKGKAAAGSKVDLGASVPKGWFIRHVTSDGRGNWIADYAHPGQGGDEQDIVDLLYGTGVDSWQSDEDSDRTSYGQSAPNPYILANPSAHWIYGMDWPLGVELILTIGDYSAKSTTIVAPWDPNTVEAYFDLNGQVDLVPGDIVIITGNNVTKKLTITNLSVTSLDVATNSLSGTASVGGTIRACADNALGGCRSATAGNDGKWSMGSVTGEFVLGKGVYGWAAEIDLDGDATRMDWRVPNPNVRMWLGDNQQFVEALEWQLGEKVTLSIFSDAEKTEILFGPATKIVGIADWDPNMTYVDFPIEGFQVVPGMLLVLTNGVITKEHIVQPITVTEGSSDTDYFAGTTTPNTWLWICVWTEGGCGEYILSDGAGNWRRDYTNSGIDIQPGTGVDVGLGDEDGDWTGFIFILPYKCFLPTVSKSVNQP